MDPIVTLTSDFGERDWFVGAMKGSVLRSCPNARLVDITHQIPRHDVKAGALALRASVPFFPEGAVHLCVVDPGVGTDRKPVAVRAGAAHFVVPDNGVLSYLLPQDSSFSAVSLADRTGTASATFHGRDVFGPAAGALAAGRPLEELGPPINRLLSFPFPETVWTEHGCAGEVLHVDVFGNLITGLGEDVQGTVRSHLRRGGRLLWRVGSKEIQGLCRAYGDVSPGEPLALWGSIGFFEIAVREGSASEFSGAGVGDTVELVLLPIDAPKGV